jgi:hypothetical protein
MSTADSLQAIPPFVSVTTAHDGGASGRSVPQDDLAPGRAAEAALVRRARDGSPDAFGALYRQEAGRVFGLCLRLTGDRVRATELTQDVFVRAWERLQGFRGPYLRQWRSRSRSKWNNVTVIIHLSPSSTDSAVGLSSLKFLARSSCSSSQILSLLCNFSLQIIINYFIFAQTQSKFIPNIHVCYMLNTILILLESKKMSPVPQSIMC